MNTRKNWEAFSEKVKCVLGEAEQAARKMFTEDESIGEEVYGTVFLEGGAITDSGVEVLVSYHDGENKKQAKTYLVPFALIKETKV
jgi:hypothetical protein